MPYDELLIVGVRPGDVEFTNENHGSFNVTMMQEWIKESGLQPFVAVMDKSNVESLVKNVDIDLDRVQEIMLEMARTQKMFDPLISVEIQDDDPLIIDGHHRLSVILALNPSKIELPMYLVPHNVAEAFKVTYTERDSRTGQTRPLDIKAMLKASFGKYTDSKGNLRK